MENGKKLLRRMKNLVDKTARQDLRQLAFRGFFRAKKAQSRKPFTAPHLAPDKKDNTVVF